MKPYILIAVLLAGFISSCHKNTIPNVPINSEMYNAFAFKEGSYWIYQDSVNGEIDSFVINMPTGMNQINNNSYTESQYVYALTGYKEESLKRYWNFYFQDSVMSFAVLDAAETLENDIGYELVVFPWKSGQRTMDFDSGVINNIFSSYSIMGNTFNNVCEINHTRSSSISTQIIRNDWFYIAENIGLVKVILNHPQDTIYHSYQLIRYKVVK